jgi:hypothetical protein
MIDMSKALTNTGLNLPADCSEEEFFEAGRFLSNIERGMQWAIGDWYNAIPWGDKEAACEKAGLRFKTACDFGKVCKKFEFPTRVGKLSFEIHRKLSHDALTPDQRADLLTEAAEQKWSAARLTKERDKLLGKPEKIPLLGFDEKVDAVVADLPKTTSGQVKTAIKRVFSDLKHGFQNEVESEVKRRLTVDRAKVLELRAEAEAERDLARKIRYGIDSHMTHDEFLLIRSCLHPDRHPDQPDKFGKAFEVFNRLEQTVNTKAPIAHLDKRGWGNSAATH